MTYQAFIVPGVIAQSVLIIAIFSGLAIIWERDLGISQRMVVAPVARSALITGRAVSTGLRAVAQVAIVLAVLAISVIPLRWSVLGIVGALVVSLIGAMLFSSISTVIASAVRSREQFMRLGQLITLPLFFASNALYPIALMPKWLQAVARLNPLTYLVELLRWLLLDIGPQNLPRAVTILVVETIIAIAAVSPSGHVVPVRELGAPAMRACNGGVRRCRRRMQSSVGLGSIADQAERGGIG